MKNFIKKTIAPLLSIVLLGLIFYNIDLNQTLIAFKGFDISNLWLIVLIYLIGFFIRVFRWNALLDECKKCKYMDLLGIIFTGNMLNSYLPARAGDFYRAYNIGKNYQIKKMKAFTTIFLERVFDGSVVFFFLLISIINVYNKGWVVNLATTVGILFLGSMLALFLFAKFGNPDTFCEKIIQISQKLPNKIQDKINPFILSLNSYFTSFIEGLESLHSIKTVLTVFLYTAGVWIFECISYMLIIQSFGIEINFLSALFIMCLIVFSTMIPSSSVFIGPYQYAYIIGLGVFGVTKEPALAVALVNQIIIMGLVTLCGLFFVLKNKQNLSSIKNDINSEAELTT